MIAFSLWPIHIYRYGIMYALTFLFGYMFFMIGQRRWLYRHYPALDSFIAQYLDTFIITAMLGIMIGGRMGHILIYDLSYFISHPLQILAINKGGMSFIGGIIGEIVAMTILVRRYNKKWWIVNGKWWISFLMLLDMIMPIIPIGIFLGRFANFLNQELYGLIVPADAWWLPSWFITILTSTHFFHVYDKIDMLLRLNTNFLSMIGEWLIVGGVVWYFFIRYWLHKKIAVWQLSAIFLLSYSVIRFFFEYLRQDSQAEFVRALTKSQWFFVGFIVFCISFLCRKNKKEIM